jgi:hypothetical protein
MQNKKIINEDIKNSFFSCFSKMDHRIFKRAIYLDRTGRDISNGRYKCTLIHPTLFLKTEFYELDEPPK